MIASEQLIINLKKVYNIIGKIPSVQAYKKYGNYDPATISRHFGSWNKALMLCFDKINQIRTNHKPIIKCLNCSKETKNPKFCSRSCAAQTNNKKFPKRKPSFKRATCQCGKQVRNSCDKCKECSMRERQLTFIISFGEKTIKEFYSTYARHKYQNIRHHAHRVAKYHNLSQLCAVCQYPHTQLCHKISISKFDKNTKLSVVNDINNIVYLCRNHHWELDNQLLILDK